MRTATAPSPSPRIPERHKKAGLCYALTDDGIELPVIDVCHPAFVLEPGEGELDALMETSLGDMRRRDAAPAFVQGILLRLMLRGSLLAQAIGGARGGFVSGMGTYLLKLGPENLGAGYAKAIDRQISSSLPCLSARLRLRDSARLLAGALVPVLQARPEARLDILDIAGGPASSTLNGLMILRRGHPGLLEGRSIRIHVLDQDQAGPAFAARSLGALMAGACPLSGLDLELEAGRHDWANVDGLGEALGGLAGVAGLAGEGILALVSEGGLFDYGSDEDIGANLGWAALAWPGEALWVGTASRPDGGAGAINAASGARVRQRGASDIGRLASAAGWTIERWVDCPLSSSFLLARQGRPGCPLPA